MDKFLGNLNYAIVAGLVLTVVVALVAPILA
jgi:hypothetical protein